jgi:hypothetical protein
MSKFKNITGFNQAVIIKGKKTLVRNGEVLEAVSTFIQEGFEKVADDVPVTVGRSRIKKSVSSDEVKVLQEEIQKLKESQGADGEQFSLLQKKLEQLETENQKSDELNDIEKRIEDLSAAALNFSGNAEQDLIELKEFVAVLSENVEVLSKSFEKQGDSISNQALVVNRMRDDQQLILKRMEILKSAMQGMELQIDEIVGYDEEVIIMDDE